jgi:hypothetical protein
MSRKGRAAKGPSSFYENATAKKGGKRKTGGSVQKNVKRRKNRTNYEPGIVFVGMAFGRGDEIEVFRTISKICKSMKLRAIRIDDNFSSGIIILEITDLIERAEFIIFDLTHERPNVYYELGYAHGVGNTPSNIMLIAKKGTKLHFDIAALRIHFYDSISELGLKVSFCLNKMMSDSRD